MFNTKSLAGGLTTRLEAWTWSMNWSELSVKVCWLTLISSNSNNKSFACIWICWTRVILQQPWEAISYKIFSHQGIVFDPCRSHCNSIWMAQPAKVLQSTKPNSVDLIAFATFACFWFIFSLPCYEMVFTRVSLSPHLFKTALCNMVGGSLLSLQPPK